MKIELPLTVGATRLRIAKLFSPVKLVVDPAFEKVVTPPLLGPVAVQLITACWLVTGMTVDPALVVIVPTPDELVTVPNSACAAAGLAPAINAVAIASIEQCVARPG